MRWMDSWTLDRRTQHLLVRRSGESYKSLPARIAAGEGDESDVAGALDRHGQRALMPGAGAELAARFDLAPFANVPAEAPDILVIDVPDIVDAKGADLAAGGEASTTTTAAAAGRTGACTATVSTAIAAITRSLGATKTGTLRPVAAIATVPAIITVVGTAALAALSIFCHGVVTFCLNAIRVRA